MKKYYNNSMNIFRVICSLLVVIIHTRPFMDSNRYFGFFVVEILPRIAVPYFFCISGYWFFKTMNNELSYQHFKDYFIKIFQIYIFWSGIYFLKDLFFYVQGGLNLKYIISTFLVQFFVYGSSYHFWYFIGIFVAIFVSYILCKINNKKLFVIVPIFFYTIGLLGTSYYAIGINIPVVSELILSSFFDIFRKVFCMGIPFFILGAYIPFVDARKLGVKFLCSIMFYLIEITVLLKFKLFSNIVITIGLPVILVYWMIILIKYPLNNCIKLSKLCRRLANWIFYVHPLFILILKPFISSNILLFLVVSIVCILTGFLIFSNEKIAKILKV